MATGIRQLLLPLRPGRALLWSRHDPVSGSTPVGRQSCVVMRRGNESTSCHMGGHRFLKTGCQCCRCGSGNSRRLGRHRTMLYWVGGDMFCLYYDAMAKQVHAINGSGQAPSELTLERVPQDCPKGSRGFPIFATRCHGPRLPPGDGRIRSGNTDRENLRWHSSWNLPHNLPKRASL
jgi:hypothetical protein